MGPNCYFYLTFWPNIPYVYNIDIRYRCCVHHLFDLFPEIVRVKRIRNFLIEREEGGGAGAAMVMQRDIDDLPKNAANYTALTPLWFLERAAQVHPNRTSVIHGSRHYTWSQTYYRCRRLASALSQRSIVHGSTVFFFHHS